MTRKRWRILARSQDGAAAIEFALSMMLFVSLTLTGLELGNMAFAHLRVSQIAMTVADNAGRVTAGIDEANIQEVFAGAQRQAGEMRFKQNGRIILSSLEVNGHTGAKAGQMIRWQRCWGDHNAAPVYGREGKGKNDSTLAAGMGPVANRIVATNVTAVMFVEAVYRYQPVFGSIGLTPPTIRYESAFNVRNRQNNAISNTQSLPLHSCT